MTWRRWGLCSDRVGRGQQCWWLCGTEHLMAVNEDLVGAFNDCQTLVRVQGLRCCYQLYTYDLHVPRWLVPVQSVIIGKKRTFHLLNFRYADERVSAVADSPWRQLKFTWRCFNQWAEVSAAQRSISHKRAARSQSDRKRKKPKTKQNKTKKRPPSLTGSRWQTKNKIRKHNTRVMETVSVWAFFPSF